MIYIIQIQSTTNYKQFKKIPGNRPLIAHQIQRLTQAILVNNKLMFHPIIVNSQMEVIDGQHRLEVARNNNLEIFYLVDPEANISDVIQSNVVMRVWNLANYLDIYLAAGNKNYQVIRDYAQDYDLSISNAALILTKNIQSRGSSGQRDLFKEGRFIPTHREWADQYLANLQMISKYTGLVRNDREFLAAFARVMDKVDMTRLLEKLVIYDRPLQIKGYIKEYLHDLDDIYNWKTSKREAVY